MDLKFCVRNKSCVLTSLAVAAILAAGIIWLVTTTGKTTPNDALQYQLAWFSTDDGKTWFADSADNLPPFDKDGKPANRAYLYRKSGGQPVVVFLERYTPNALSQLNDLKKPTGRPPEIGLRERIIAVGVEVKKPGDQSWINVSDPRAAGVMRPRLSATDNTALEPVLP